MSESVSFDRAAGYYDRTRALPDSLMARLIPMLGAELPRDGMCLEIGVGTGRIALPLVRQGLRLVGVDISRDMLRRLVDNAGRTSTQVVEGDATRLPFRDRTFTSAIAAHVLHLIPDWSRAVGELMRVLGTGGILIASRGARTTLRKQGAAPTDNWAGRVAHRFFSEAGNPPWPPGVDNIEQIDEHMRGLGATVRELPELSTESSNSVTGMLANLEAGYWSACWSLDESTRKNAASRTRTWAKQELGDLDELRPTADSSVWHVYQLGK